MKSKETKLTGPGFLEEGWGGTGIEGVATGETDSPPCHKARMGIRPGAGCSLHSGEEASMKVRTKYIAIGRAKRGLGSTNQ